MSIYLTRQMIGPSARCRGAANDKGGLLRRWLRAAARRRRQRRTIATLQGLDDRMLADIGLRRSDIPGAVETFGAHELRMVPVAKSIRAEDAERHAYLQAA